MLDFDILFPSVLNGLTTGAVYALIALGLTLIYGVLHIINFAHGAWLTVGAYCAVVTAKLGLNPWAALPLAFAVGAALDAFGHSVCRADCLQ